MDNKEIVNIDTAIVDVKVDFKDGKFIMSAELSPKGLIDLLAEKVGGPVPKAVAEFIEMALQLK